MATNNDIAKIVKKLIKKHSTNDPWELAKELKINLYEKQLNLKIKGAFFNPLKEVKQIFINSNLDHFSRKIVLAHEIGHAVLHTKLGIGFIREYTLFPTGKFEVQANKFAAELLLDDSERDLLLEHGSIGVARGLGVPEELVLYKFNK